VGPSTGQLVEAILAAKRHPSRAIGLAWGFCDWRRPTRPSAWKRPRGAAYGAAYNFQSMDSILKNQLDRLPLPGDPPVRLPWTTTTSAAPGIRFPPEIDPPVIQ